MQMWQNLNSFFWLNIALYQLTVCLQRTHPVDDCRAGVNRTVKHRNGENRSGEKPLEVGDAYSWYRDLGPVGQV